MAWIAILANKDFKTHHVRTNALILSDQARISRENAEDAIRVLCSPDPDSLDPEFEGRRLEKLPAGGYVVLNGAKYSKLMAEFRKKEYDRERKREERAGDDPNSDGIPEKTKRHQTAIPILAYLNEKTGKHYRETETNLGFIGERLSEEGVTADGVRQMIDRQSKKWAGSNMEDYMRPETLFNKTKFDGYYAARDQPVINGSPESKPAYKPSKHIP